MTKFGLTQLWPFFFFFLEVVNDIVSIRAQYIRNYQFVSKKRKYELYFEKGS